MPKKIRKSKPKWSNWTRGVRDEEQVRKNIAELEEKHGDMITGDMLEQLMKEALNHTFSEYNQWHLQYMQIVVFYMQL